MQMSRRISLLLPTRNRPFLLKRLFRSIIDHTYDINNLEIILCLDNDDAESRSIEDYRLNIVKTIGPPGTMGEYNTRCLQASSGDLIMLMNDDLTMCTIGWDQLIINFANRISDGIFLAYPDDMEKANLSTFPILSRKTCEILKIPYPKEYEDTFIDDHIFDIFIRLKRLGHNRIFYLDNIKLDHRHFINDKVRPDVNYSHKNRYKDGLIFLSLRHLRQTQAMRLLAAIKGRSMPPLSDKVEMVEPAKNLAQAFLRYSSICLTDYGLPIFRRLRWLIRFTKYYAAMKSGMSFLRNKTYTLYGSG